MDALLARAAFSVEEGKPGEAIADLRSALAKQSDSQRGMLLLARTYVLNGDMELAEDAYRKLVELNPTHRIARNELAILIGNRGDAEQAARLLRDTLEMAPGDIGASRNLVTALMIEQDFDAAAQEAQRMIELGDMSGDADYQLGVALQGKGDLDGAMSAYRQSLDKNPRSEASLASLSQLLAQNGRTADAEQLLTSTSADHPDFALPHVLLGELYRANGREPEARQQYRTAIERDPAATGAYVGLAGTWPGNSDEQLEVLRAGYAAVPGDRRLALALGSAYKERGQFEEAIGIYEDVVRRNGGDDMIVTNLAFLLLDVRTDADSYARALELVLRFEREASHPFNVAALGWAYHRNGQGARAVRQLERAVAAIGENPKLRYYLGMAYLAQANRVDARGELRKSVDLADAAGGWFQGYEEAVAALEELEAS